MDPRCEEQLRGMAEKADNPEFTMLMWQSAKQALIKIEALRAELTQAQERVKELTQGTANYLEIATEEAEKRDTLEQELDQLKRERDGAVERADRVTQAAWIRTESYEAIQEIENSYRQGFEACREAVRADVGKLRDILTWELTNLISSQRRAQAQSGRQQLCKLDDRIRALTVPERKEL